MSDTTVRIRLVIHPVTEPATGADPGGRHGGAGPLRPARPPRSPEERPLVSSVTTRAHGPVLDVVLSGDVDLLLRDELALVLAEAATHSHAHDRARVVLDLTAVSAVDSTAVRFVDRLRRRTEDAGGTCTVTGARPAVRRVLDLAVPALRAAPAFAAS